MELNKRVKGLVELGLKINEAIGREEGQYEGLSKAQINLLVSSKKATLANPWFPALSIKNALESIVTMLDEISLVDWIGDYYEEIRRPILSKKVGVIMAGNIPAVGFHDMLAVLISGHSLIAKTSSEDKEIIPAIAGLLIEIEPAFSDRITILTEPFKEFDAMIATGSDNSARYFEHYFGKYPNIIRKSRTSLAVLNGKEDEIDFKYLANDIFQYFGLGCRNVSKVFIPKGFKIERLIAALEKEAKVLDNSKYINNLEYHKSIFLINREPFLDGGFFIVRKNESLYSPISVLHYEEYEKEEELTDFIEENKESIQCVVDKSGDLGGVRFGEAQVPKVSDYADKVDTMKFLLSL